MSRNWWNAGPWAAEALVRKAHDENYGKLVHLEYMEAMMGVHYSAAGKHRIGMFLTAALVIPALYHYWMMRQHRVLAEQYAREVYEALEDGRLRNLSSGSYDVMGTILADSNEKAAMKCLHEAVRIAKARVAPLHETGLPLARMALIMAKRPAPTDEMVDVAQEYIEEVTGICKDNLADKNVANRRPEQTSRMLLLMARYYQAKGELEDAKRITTEGFELAKSHGAWSQMWNHRFFYWRIVLLG